jgi:DNA repair protein RecN (Recombination protein N)
MLLSLKVTNYALIEELEIDMHLGFTAITGETGAGKSILLGALGLVLGNRAETNVLMNPNSKCVVEAVFDLSKMIIRSFFEENDLDYHDESVLRREINPNGKSRAFINDSPVNLNLLKEIGNFLVDIHSQHDSLLLSNSGFQLELIDELAEHEDLLNTYKSEFKSFKQLQKELNALRQFAREKSADLDYLRFQFDELDKARLVKDEFAELKVRYDILSHAVELRSGLLRAGDCLEQEESNAIQLVKESIQHIIKLGRVLPECESISTRLESCLIELKDISSELKVLESKVYFDENELVKSQERLDLLTQLIHKHRVLEVEELILLRDGLWKKIQMIDNSEYQIELLAKQLSEKNQLVIQLAIQIQEGRLRIVPDFEKEILDVLVQLGMPNARFQIQLDSLSEPDSTGNDKVKFLFNANKGGQMDEIARVASGGELSRLMLAIKSLVSGKRYTPTLIFDEIDTGVSGEIAAKVGRIMASMSKKVQVISITHLPQIAGKANQHLLVYKTEDIDRTKSEIIQLNDLQRIEEIARMLSDDTITEASRSAAKELIKSN